MKGIRQNVLFLSSFIYLKLSVGDLELGQMILAIKYSSI